MVNKNIKLLAVIAVSSIFLNKKNDTDLRHPFSKFRKAFEIRHYGKVVKYNKSSGKWTIKRNNKYVFYYLDSEDLHDSGMKGHQLNVGDTISFDVDPFGDISNIKIV